MANSYTDASGVFRNKLGFTDAGQLRNFEYELTANRSKEILEGRVQLNASGYDLERQSAIHRHLFQDVYEWAGRIRTVALSKRVANGIESRFTEPEAIARDWQALAQKTAEFVAGKGWSFEHKRDALTDIFIAANHIHAFPEGNGRSLQVLMKQLAKERGVHLDYTKAHFQEWNFASAVSGLHGRLFEHLHLIPLPPNAEPIRKIFSDIASPMPDAD